MTKQLHFVFFISVLLAWPSHGQCPNGKTEVTGEIKTFGKCNNPEIVIKIITKDSSIIGGELFVENVRSPFKFNSSCLELNNTTEYYLKVTFHSPNDFAITPDSNLKLNGSRKTLRAKRVSDIYHEVVSNVNSLYKDKFYAKGLASLASFADLDLNLTASQTYRVAYLQADGYNKEGNNEAAAQALEQLLESPIELDANKKYQSLRFLSTIYGNEKDYANQKKALDGMHPLIESNSLSKAKLSEYYKEYFNNFLNRSGYSSYKISPALELSKDLDTETLTGVSKAEWEKFFSDWSRFRNEQNALEKPLVKQIMFADSALNPINNQF